MLRPFYRQGGLAACGGRQPRQQPRIPVLAEDGLPRSGWRLPGVPVGRRLSLDAASHRLCTRGRSHACGAVGPWQTPRPPWTPGGESSHRPGRPSRPGKNGRKVPAVGALWAIDVADPDVDVVRAEKVGPVGGAVHPPVESLLRRAGGRVARGVDILPDPGPAVPLPPHPITRARSVRASVREKTIAGHVGAVEPRRRLELALKIVELEPLGLALGVDQAQ